MQTFFVVLMGLLLAIIFLMILKMIRGKTIYDRLNGLSVINADIILLIIIFGFHDGRPEMYLDIALAYGFLGFVTNIIVAKYVRERRS